MTVPEGWFGVSPATVATVYVNVPRAARNVIVPALEVSVALYGYVAGDVPLMVTVQLVAGGRPCSRNVKDTIPTPSASRTPTVVATPFTKKLIPLDPAIR